MADTFISNILLYSKSSLLEQLLKQHCRHSFVTVRDEAHFRKEIAATPPHAVIINNDNTEEDTSLLQWEQHNFIAPVIVLSSSVIPSPYWLQKPVRLQNLLRILEEILVQEVSISLSDMYILQPVNRTIKTPAHIVALTEKETALLKYLYDAKGECVTKAELLQHIWGYADDIDTHTIETHIYRLRQKIGENEELIITDGDGYRLR